MQQTKPSPYVKKRPQSAQTQTRPTQPQTRRRPAAATTKRAPFKVKAKTTALATAMPVPSGPELCPIQRSCGGCSSINLSYDKSLKIKFEAGIAKLQSQGLTSPGKANCTASPRTETYRSTVKLAVRKGSGEERFLIGLFKPETHSVVDITSCPLHTRPLRAFFFCLKQELERSTLQPYDEASHSGDLRYVVAKTTQLTREIMVTFVVTNENAKHELKTLVKKLRLREIRIVGAFLDVHSEPGNAIFSGAPLLKLVGQERLRTPINGIPLESSPSAFSQVNPWQAAQVYQRIVQLAGQAKPGELAWDLYCGSGPISMTLAHAGYRVVGCEENPTAILDAEHNRRLNKFETTQLQFHVGRVEDVLPQMPQAPSLIVVNPSRRGLAAEARSAIAAQLRERPRTRLIYMSCSLETLTRDLLDFKEQGLELKQIEAFDMFARTTDLEWLCLLTAKTESAWNA